ncbi:MAG: ABC transporter ATP-binding protein [Ignavibacteria bacterium]|nr:ABC transporter ATP-binding protein [Ignavibacteria bacterium]
MEFALSIKNVGKKYGDVIALNGVSLDVKKNIIFGIVGPDGAGKSTLIRILCGLLKPDEGEINILDAEMPKDYLKIKDSIGYLSQKFSLYADLTVDENIEFIAEIHGVKEFHDRRDELLEFTRMKKFRKFLAGNLSGGMKQKLALACTLIYQPKLLFLDEPTTGVDPVSRREFWLILAGLLKEDITIIISTPYMEEAERFNEIALIENGHILAVDSPAGIKSRIRNTVLEIVCTPARKAYDLILASGDDEVQLFGDRVNVILDNKAGSEEKVVKLLKDNEIIINDLRKTSPTLENAFIHLLKESA